MSDYDPIRELIETGRAMMQVVGELGLDYWPQYADFLAELDRAERWVDDPETVEVK